MAHMEGLFKMDDIFYEQPWHVSYNLPDLSISGTFLHREASGVWWPACWGRWSRTCCWPWLASSQQNCANFALFRLSQRLWVGRASHCLLRAWVREILSKLRVAWIKSNWHWHFAFLDCLEKNDLFSYKITNQQLLTDRYEVISDFKTRLQNQKEINWIISRFHDQNMSDLTLIRSHLKQ